MTQKYKKSGCPVCKDHFYDDASLLKHAAESNDDEHQYLAKHPKSLHSYWGCGASSDSSNFNGLELPIWAAMFGG